MPSRILVIEDEPAIVRVLVDALEARGYAVEAIDRGDDARGRLAAGNFDLVILDICLPGASGFELLREFRTAGMQTPVVMLTARGAEPDRVLGFELGVDDYVTKPFSVLELLGRVKAVLRRTGQPPAGDGQGPQVAALGPARFDFKRLEVNGGLRNAPLSAKGFAVAQELARAAGAVVSRDDLISHVWGEDEYINTRTIDNIIARLRQIVEEDPANPRWIKTIYGVGYQLGPFPEAGRGILKAVNNKRGRGRMVE